MQHDAAGAARELGATLAGFPCPHLSLSRDAESGAADAERWACVPLSPMPVYRTARAVTACSENLSRAYIGPAYLHNAARGARCGR